MQLTVLTTLYLFASVTFIIGLRMLSHPATARKGNLVAATGMTLAILGTIFLYQDENGNKLHNYLFIFAGLIAGSVIGTLAAKKVKMTAMPEMVSLFNGMGGACAALIAMIEFNHLSALISQVADITYPVAFVTNDGRSAIAGRLLIILAGLIIGSVSFAGSVIAWGKLNGKVRDFSFKGQHIFNIILLLIILSLAALLIFDLTRISNNFFYLIFA
nr:NAD(P)(+) transhydrogenase (Re/Si-specific) subunit beta [Segetibacter sp.]